MKQVICPILLWRHKLVLMCPVTGGGSGSDPAGCCRGIALRRAQMMSTGTGNVGRKKLLASRHHLTSTNAFGLLTGANTAIMVARRSTSSSTTSTLAFVLLVGLLSRLATPCCDAYLFWKKAVPATSCQSTQGRRNRSPYTSQVI